MTTNGVFPLERETDELKQLIRRRIDVLDIRKHSDDDVLDELSVGAESGVGIGETADDLRLVDVSDASRQTDRSVYEEAANKFIIVAYES